MDAISGLHSNPRSSVPQYILVLFNIADSLPVRHGQSIGRHFLIPPMQCTIQGPA